MMDACSIEPIEESKCINPIVVQYKETTGEVKICVDLSILNDSSLHDPFSTPFIDEVLENVRGQDIYSSPDGFSGYHHIRTAKEDRHKTTFST